MMRAGAAGPSDEAPVRSSERGYALAFVLFIVVVLSGVVAMSHLASRTEVRIGTNDYLSVQATYAAEAGAEKFLAEMRQALADGAITQTEIQTAASAPPSVPGYTFVNYGATLTGSVTTRQISQGPFAGLVSLDQDLLVTSAVEGPAGARASVELAARAQAIPIFQFAAFYEDDLENFPGPRMDLGGRVHTNGELYVDSQTGLYFWDMVTAAGDLHIHTKASAGASSDGLDVYVQRNDDSWVEVLKDGHDFGVDDNPVTFPTTAQDESFDDWSKANWDHNIQTRASGIRPLNLPIPTGIDPYELIQPCTGAESQSLAELKYACNAGLTIRLRRQGNAYLFDFLDQGGGSVALSDPSAVAFAPNQFYDDREQNSAGGSQNNTSNRDVIEIDLSKFQVADYANGGVYVFYSGASGPAADRQTVVRVRGGAVLKAPLTIATDRPLYVQGDFNSDDNFWQPASFASDAITILSAAWDDTRSGEGPTENSPFNTKVQAAFLSGHSPTPFFGSPDGGGWLNNYPRFLEIWSGRTATINGSLVSLWFAQVAQGPFACCQYYSPPNRDWNFDPRFLDPANLPPFTPVVGQVLRLGFMRQY
jgi:hypothetical protein